MTNRFTTAEPTGAIRLWAPRAIATFLAMAALWALTAAPPADAAAQKARPAQSAEATAPRQAGEATAPRKAGEAIMAIVSIKSQKVTIYDADGWILSAPVSTGTKGRETPAGIFAVVEKNKDHRSNMYDDAWMPNMLRITWNGIALHGGPLPGYPASHGCVRMPFGFAEKLFDRMRMNTRIIISPNDAEPVEFSHPALFVPNPEALAAARARAERLTREADEAAKTAKQAKNAAAKREMASLRKLEQANIRAKAELAAAERRLAAAKTDQAKAKAEDQQQKAAARAAELRTQLDAAKAAREAKLALVPVSVFISRATQKLYVRRNTQERLPDGGEMFDAIEFPVTIRNPGQPIGTHVITAVASTDRGLRWTAVTVDGAGDAKGALDRITIPQEVIDRLAPTALPRSAIIISDEPLHRETNYRTEFVVALNNQPQGGLITRPRTEPELSVGRNIWEDAGSFGFFRQREPRYDDPRQRGGRFDQRQDGRFFFPR
jgi:lipoprotein-anchoring transpeptidase ErfK/SrfK